MVSIDVDWQRPKEGRAALDDRQGRRTWGDAWPTLRRRLAVLRAAPTLEDIRNTPGRPHALTGDLRGLISVGLSANYRLLFRPTAHPLPELPDGGLDWARVTSIEIEGVSDYHGR